MISIKLLKEYIEVKDVKEGFQRDNKDFGDEEVWGKEVFSFKFNFGSEKVYNNYLIVYKDINVILLVLFIIYIDVRVYS